MSKSYIEKYGMDMVKKHLRNRHNGRYFKVHGDYCNIGIVIFNENLFKSDIDLFNFPIVKTNQNGWNLSKAPTPEEFEVIYNYLKQEVTK